MFDPLGFISPIAISARIITQACWRHDIGWDQELPESVLKVWKKWVDSLTDLPNCRLDRCIKPVEGKLNSEEVHIFCDGSTQAYGAVAYNKCVMEDGTVYTNIIVSKAKVAPIKTETVNKLELRGAVIAVTLAKLIRRVLKVPKKDIFFWTDSKNVLAWLHTKKWLTRFVINRVTEIKEASDVTAWRWVPGSLNPADELSRGLNATQLLKATRWWRGPEFIQKPDRSQWPDQPLILDSTVRETINEKVIGVPFNGPTARQKAQLRTQSAADEINFLAVKIDEENPLITRFSSWQKYVKVNCWMKRWIEKLKSKKRAKISVSKAKDSSNPLPYVNKINYFPPLKSVIKPITGLEYNRMEKILIRQEQLRHFAETFDQLSQNDSVLVKNHLFKLNPILDENGILRVFGRLKDSEILDLDAARPIILPKGEHVTKLILRHYHHVVCDHYGGAQYLLARIRERFWPVNGNTAARKILASCAKCKIKKPQKITQQMATLPEFRIPNIGELDSIVAYSNTGVDYAGPFITQQGRGKSRMKRWICLFTCLQCRAVHIEIVYNLTAESFLLAFERFVSQNSRPKNVYLDNQTTFVRAEADLQKWLKGNVQSLIGLANQKFPQIEFHFIPPHSPNYGGAWESMIKLAKRGYYDCIKPGIVTDEELLTAFKVVEGHLNSRPLTTVSSDPGDHKVLTPAHFLLRGAYSKLAPFPKHWSQKERYLFTQDLVASMWTRFLKEIIPLKNKYEKNVKHVEEVRIGEVVVLLNELDRNVAWPIAIVKEVHKSHDGVIRKATLTFNGKDYVRSSNHFTKLRFLNW